MTINFFTLFALFAVFTAIDAVAQHDIIRLPHIPKSRRAADTLRADSARTYKAGTVVVTGTRNAVLLKDSPMRVELIESKQLQTTAMTTIADVLREQTGLLLTTNVRTGVQMMGLGSDYTQILIDGQPMTGRVAGVIDLNRVSTGNIERVEIVKGPMSSLYGSDALAGVINIITQKPASGWSGKFYGQMLQRGASELQTEIGYGGENINASGYCNYRNAAAFVASDGTKSVPYSGFEDYTAHIKAKWYALPTLNFSGTGRLFHAESSGKFIESFFGQIAENQGSVIQSEKSGTITGSWTHGAARLSSEAYLTHYSEIYNFDTVQGTAGRVDNLDRMTARGFLQYDVLWSERDRFTFGTEFLYDDISGSRYPDRPSFNTFALFGQWEGNPTSWASYSLSSRYTHNSAYPNAGFGGGFDSSVKVLAWLLNPKFALNIKVNDNWQVRGSVGTGFKVPDFRQLYVEFSNRLAGAGYDLIGARRLGLDLQPERSTAFDLGVQWHPSAFEPFFGISAEIFTEARCFRNNLSNLIEYYYVGQDPSGTRAIYSYRNLSRVYTQGIEANFRCSAHLSEKKSVTVSAGYQYLDANDVEVLEAIENGTAGTVNPSSGVFTRLTREMYGGLWFRSRNSGAASVRYDDEGSGWSANIRAQFIGRFGNEALDKNGVSVSNPQRITLDRDDEYATGYIMLNCAVGKTFRLGGGTHTAITVNTGINNLTNAMNLVSIPSLVGRQLFINAAYLWQKD
ncbi:TonB-dependent receptor [Ignavibacteria bacterium]|nr:TonB-dependent receptor [Bacteroidota bacterium]MCZ2132292.1 TonB-dependent receptor [Bacteroidota bacterium]